MVGGDGRPEMVERLLEKAEREFAASTRRLCPALYTADGSGQVVPYARAAGDPLAARVKIAQENLAIYEHRVFEGATGDAPHSLSVWTKGVRTYLPHTEKVMLFVPADQEGAKPKPMVEVFSEAIAGRLTAVADLYPPLFETTGEFPSDAELRSLEGQSLAPARERPSWRAPRFEIATGGRDRNAAGPPMPRSCEARAVTA